MRNEKVETPFTLSVAKGLIIKRFGDASARTVQTSSFRINRVRRLC